MLNKNKNKTLTFCQIQKYIYYLPVLEGNKYQFKCILGEDYTQLFFKLSPEKLVTQQHQT